MIFMTENKGQAGGWLSPMLEYQRILQAKRFIPENVDILDIGCGRARVLEHVTSVHSYIGIDVLDEVLVENRKRYGAYEFYRVNIEREKLPGESRTFQIILMLAVLEHFSSPERALQNTVAYLDPNGKIILTTPHPSAARLHALGASTGIFSREADEEHGKFFDRKLLEELVLSWGLKILLYEKFQFGLNQVVVMEHDHAKSIQAV
jgi:SAM-dependent methyltransferase